MNPIVKQKQMIGLKNFDFGLLIFSSIILLFLLLGSREIWTLEWRWASVTSEMLRRHDFFHPYFLNTPYYDKPLLSYWLILLSRFLTGGVLSEWSLRIPSAVAGVITIGCTYWLGKHLFNRRTGILAGWLLLTTYSFIFWSRTASADMLNVCGIYLALVWYFANANDTSFKAYFVFFLILAMTSLIKGLIGFVVPLLLLLPDVILRKSWKKHLKISLLISFIFAFIFYLTPFLVSAYWNSDQYTQNGLFSVFKENIVRYFEPFDHKASFFSYFIYLPLYLLPWTPFFLIAFFYNIKKWISQTVQIKWLLTAIFILFVFFTVSGSRRSYYILPLLPLTILLTAHWFNLKISTSSFSKYFYSVLSLIFLILMSWFCIVQPIYYVKGGTRDFANYLRKQTQPVLPWSRWNIALFDAKDKIIFYLANAHSIQQVFIPDSASRALRENLLNKYLNESHPSPTILIIPEKYRQQIQQQGNAHSILSMPSHLLEKRIDVDDPIALIINE